MPAAAAVGGLPSRASNCALMTICVVCICVLVLCGVMVVREYALARMYLPTTCSITDVQITEHLHCQFCGQAKGKPKEKGAGTCSMSSFPCLRVQAAYKAQDGGKEGAGEDNVGIIHPDSLQAWGKYSQCSFSICLKEVNDNDIAVKKEAAYWESRKGDSFRCYYNTDNFKHLIMVKRHNKSDVIHSMLWPSLIILLCGIIFLKLEMQRRGITLCRSSEEKKGAAPVYVEEGPAGTVMEWHPNGEPCRVECKLLRCQDVTGAPTSSHLSCSLPALDRIHITGKPQARLAPSISADGLKHLRVNPNGDKGWEDPLIKKSLSKYRQDSTKTDSTGSQGSKIQGLETPV